MRERTTWNRDSIVKASSNGKTAEDPRAMNQDHLKQQPAADAYSTGGPSEFAEDVHPSTGTWKAEQSGGETKRNEIGMPEMRGDTFNHPEKTAAMDDESILKKADLCTKVARQMLPKTASEAEVEDQALAFMHMPDTALIATANRLASVVADDEEEEDEGQGKQAKDAQQDEKKQGQGNQQGKQSEQDEKKAKDAADAAQQDKKQGQGQNQQGKQSEQDEKKQGQGQNQQSKQGKDSGQVPPQFLENIKKKKDEAKGDDDKDQGKNKEASVTAGDQFVQAIQANDGQGVQQALSQMIQQAFQQLGQQQQQGATAIQGQQPQQQQAYAIGQQQPMAQGQNQQQMAQQQPMQQGQQPQQQQAGIPPSIGQQQPMADDQLLDQMLQDDLGQPGQQQMMMAAGEGPEIQLEANAMDVGETVLGEADEVLNTLFASNTEYQNAAEAHAIQNGGQRPMTAAQPMTRTAATRTVGTRPTAGVSQIGGGMAPGNGGPSDVDKLSGLWQSAPDVSNVFR